MLQARDPLGLQERGSAPVIPTGELPEGTQLPNGSYFNPFIEGTGQESNEEVRASASAAGDVVFEYVPGHSNTWEQALAIRATLGAFAASTTNMAAAAGEDDPFVIEQPIEAPSAMQEAADLGAVLSGEVSEERSAPGSGGVSGGRCPTCEANEGATAVVAILGLLGSIGVGIEDFAGRLFQRARRYVSYLRRAGTPAPTPAPRAAATTTGTGGPEAARGVQFGQASVRSTFAHGPFAGRTSGDVARGLRAGRISPDQLPVEFIVRNGERVAMNNRSLLTLRRAGLEPTRLIDRTGIPRFERLLDAHLRGASPSDVIRVRGGPPGTSLIE